MQKVNILFGFNEPVFEEGVKKALHASGYDVNIVVKLTKLSIREYLRDNDSCNTVILKEVINNKSIYSAEELSELTDHRDVNVIIVINSWHHGTGYMHILYNAGITCAIFQNGNRGATPKQVSEFVITKRTRKQAREYYGIDKRKVETGILDKDSFYEIYNDMLCQNAENSLIENYLTVCNRLNLRQLYDFTRRLPDEMIAELRRYEEFFDVVRSLKKSGLDLKIKKRRITKTRLRFPTDIQEKSSKAEKINVQPIITEDVTAEGTSLFVKGGKERSTLLDLAGQLFRVDEKEDKMIPDDSILETGDENILPDKETLSNELIDLAVSAGTDDPKVHTISYDEVEGMADRKEKVKHYYPIVFITAVVCLILFYLIYRFSLI